MMQCRLCPHECGADRREKLGVCRAPARPVVALASLHHWEEPAVSGSQGSGAIFFSHCNLACVFCQNWDISQGVREPGSGGVIVRGREVSVERLREIAFELKAQGAHNINLVSPTPYSEMILEALLPVRKELGIPIVWNSNAYEPVGVLRRLEPLVDVYLPDLKFQSPEAAQKYCGTADYFQYANQAIGEMHRQKPVAKLQEGGGLMTQGLIIRHLVIPGLVEDSKRILTWIADNIGTQVHISLMAQYTPVHKASRFPELNRRLRQSEFAAVCERYTELGFENGWVQELSAASSEYTPEFDLRGT